MMRKTTTEEKQKIARLIAQYRDEHGGRPSWRRAAATWAAVSAPFIAALVTGRIAALPALFVLAGCLLLHRSLSTL
jgi:hypothetical protein